MIRSGIVCVVAMLMMAWLVPGAEARTLEEILKDKGVITAEDYAEASKTSNLAYYKPGKGMTMQTADGNYKAHIGGYAQLIYRFTDYDDSAKSNKSDFDIRRFKIQLKGNLVSKQFIYKFQGDVSSGFRTEDVYFGYLYNQHLKLHVGQFKPAQARQELTSAAKQLFPERSLANDYFNLGRDQGLQVSGSCLDKVVEYRLGVNNGNGPNTSNPDDNHMWTGRLDINPLGAFKMNEAGFPVKKPLLNLGTSFSYNTVSGDDVGGNFNKDNDVLDKALELDKLDKTTFTANYGDEMEVLVLTANAHFKWSTLTLAGEYYTMNAEPDKGDEWDADGFYLQAGYQVIPDTLEFGARYTAVDSDSATATRLVSAEFDKSETQLGINYYLKKHQAKLQADLTFAENNLSADSDDTVFRLQAQFYY